MDRFTEELIHNSARPDRDEDGNFEPLYLDPSEYPQQFRCDSCGDYRPLALLGLEEEPQCTCIQTDVDYFDGRYCDLHGTRNPKTFLVCKLCIGTEEVADVEYEPVLQISQLLGPPPVPSREFDWVAWEDGQEERGSAFGATRDEAVENLLEERDVYIR